MKIRKLTDVKNLKNKRVLVRVDFNVPIKDGIVKDIYKIEKTLPTIQYLIKKGAQVILVSHLGRPNGVDKSLSLDPIVKVLEKLLGASVILSKAKDLDFSTMFANARSAQNDNKIILLENIRFYPGEEKNDPKFAKQLASIADIFVLDGFAVAHRASASITGVAKYLPAYAGLLLAEEIEGLSRVLNKPKTPLIVIIGGVKCETKIPVLNNFLKKASYILVGGGIFSTYLWAKGNKIGASLVDKDFKKEILKICANKKIILPVDVVVGKKDGSGARIVNCHPERSPKGGVEGSRFFDSLRSLAMTGGEAIYDVGPRTVQLFAKYIKRANTLVMNGALGYFEQSPYQHGTYAISRLFASRSKGKAFGVAGGGETVQILQKLGIIDNVDLVSTGGGAMLEFLGGKKLPGVKTVEI
ncbi:MAG: phosphoglycerate kinase [Candidatus Magasanikbacteria bacterium]